MRTDGRKEAVVVVPGWGGRDAGKHFHITERYALHAERWWAKVVFALKGTSARIPEELASFGYAALVIRGVNAVFGADVDPRVLLPLADELLQQIKMIRDPRHPEVKSEVIWEGEDVAEVKTVTWLRQEVLSLEMGFSILDEFLKWYSMFLSQTQPATPTSPSPSGSPSPLDASASKH